MTVVIVIEVMLVVLVMLVCGCIRRDFNMG